MRQQTTKRVNELEQKLEEKDRQRKEHFETKKRILDSNNFDEIGNFYSTAKRLDSEKHEIRLSIMDVYQEELDYVTEQLEKSDSTDIVEQERLSKAFIEILGKLG